MNPKKPYQNVLVIQSPVHHPAYAPITWLRVAQAIDPLVEKASMFDAGLDFFTQMMIQPDRVTEMADSFLNNPVDPLPADIASVLKAVDAELISDLASPKRSEAVLADIWHTLRSRQFFEPRIVQDKLEALDVLRALFSLAYHPCRFYADGFAHPDLHTFEDVVKLAHDSTANPFWHYAHEIWQPVSAKSTPELALLCMTSAGQALAAATLISAWERRWPETDIRVCAPHGIALHFEDALLRRTHSGKNASDQERLVSLAQEVYNAAEPFVENRSELSGDYMLPMLRDATDPSAVESQRAPISLSMTADRLSWAVDETAVRETSMIVWHTPKAETATITRALYAVSRSGIWNHVIVQGKDNDPLVEFARANPNIVHSWHRRWPPISTYSDPYDQLPVHATTYGDTEQLPGHPIWMGLREPVYINLYLRHFGFKPILRMRLSQQEHEAYQIGSRIDYRFSAPEDLPEGYLDKIVQMIAAGGSVNLRFVRKNLERAHLIAYAEEQGVLIGDSCLKHPREEYIEAVSEQIGVDLIGYLERGYTSVKPEYRGLGVGAKLLEGLTARAKDYKIFSVIAEGNTATQKMAVRNRTRRVATYFSQRTNKMIGIWIPEWMLPEGIELPPQPDLDQT